jgi:hypothetical protein
LEQINGATWPASEVAKQHQYKYSDRGLCHIVQSSFCAWAKHFGQICRRLLARLAGQITSVYNIGKALD